MLKFVGPLITVEDIARSRKFYEQVLGQKVKCDFGEDIPFEGGFTIHLRPHFQELLGNPVRYPVAAKAHNGELYFESDQIESLPQRLGDAGVEFIHTIREQPWGQRVMRFYDPDGHIIEIGEPMEAVVRRFHSQGMTPGAIAQTTSLPKEFVDQALSGK